ncbi:MAG: hypothetical protein ACE5KT_05850 [Methanosarcinales archaeon]
MQVWNLGVQNAKILPSICGVCKLGIYKVQNAKTFHDLFKTLHKRFINAS